MAQPAGKDSVSVASSCPPDNIRPAEERLEQRKNSGDRIWNIEFTWAAVRMAGGCYLGEVVACGCGLSE